MENGTFALLVIDMDRRLEEYLLARESGAMREPLPNEPRAPGRTLRQGFDDIVETVCVAAELGVLVLATEYPWRGDWEKARVCPSISGMIGCDEVYPKRHLSGYDSRQFAARLQRENVRRVLIVGYDREMCVFATARDARRLGLEVFVCERALLTSAHPSEDARPTVVQRWFRRHARVLGSLRQAHDLLRAAGRA